MQQLAEYAVEKEKDAVSLFESFAEMEEALRALLSSSSSAAAAPSSSAGAAGDDVTTAAAAERLERLKKSLVEATREARAFSRQQQVRKEKT
jgi:hypothetical protein